MRKKIGLIIAGVSVILLALLIWRLDIPNWKKLDLSKLTALPNATQVYDADGNLAGTLHSGENRNWVSLSEIPQHVQEAFIAAEDLRFYKHSGIDIYRIFGALWQDIKTMSLSQGASTITQQLIKLTHLTSTKTLSRKVQEAFLALQLERQMSKQEILEAYLNIVNFGHGAYGIESASQIYFDKPASELSLAEGALLAGVIKSPSNYAPHLNAEKSISRRNSILTTMAENEFITEAEAQAAKNERLMLASEKADAVQYGWYMDAVLTEAEQCLNLSSEEILSGGFQIYTGLDPIMQANAEALFADDSNFPEDASDGTPAQAALIALETGSGEIRALIGGRSYDVRRGLNRATQAQRQPGSAFKPISSYAAAIDAYGFVPTSTVEDTPRTFDGGYTPRNAGGNTYGTVTLREALSRSLNIATVDLADLIGTQALRTYAARFGIPLSAQDVNLSLALGSLTDGVSPANLCAAYCALANGGTQVEAHIIRSIKDADGKEIYRAPKATTQAVDASTAYMITDMLKTAASQGSAKALSASGMPVAGKTGTVNETSGGTRDIWTVAYTPDIAVATWMGFDNPDATHALPASAGGSGQPAQLCAAFLKSNASRLTGRDFTQPTSVKTALLDSVALEKDHVALLSTEKTPSEYTTQELFHTYDVPQTFSTNWVAPTSVGDFRLLTGNGETPVLAFTAVEDSAEYLIMRTANGETRQIAALRGEVGQEIRFADTEHDLSQLALYTLLPRNALLYEDGILLTGGESAPVQYVPGGLLNTIMGVGEAEATQTPTEIDLNPDQSLFS